MSKFDEMPTGVEAMPIEPANPEDSVKLTAEQQELYEAIGASLDNEQLLAKAKEVGPQGVREVLKKGVMSVGKNIKAFATFAVLAGGALVPSFAGGNGIDKPEGWLSQAEFNRAWAMAASDKAGNLPESETIRYFRQLGYTDAQIASVMPGAKIVPQPVDSATVSNIASIDE
jgi:hypothetical protein